ncbi:MAG TPA: response regulator [Bryobacteraceae bacterium]|nr:response regulator [Bryobacteraceae bacterium]
MPSGSRRRILIVEDQAPVRRLIALWLHRNGFVTFEVGHAGEALAWLRSHARSVDLAVIDLVGTNGLDLAADLTRDSSHIPILYISGYVDSLVAEAIGRRAPESLLLKPFTERALIYRVRRLLRLPATAESALEEPLDGPGTLQRRCG